MMMPATASTLSATLQRSRDLARRTGIAGFWSWWGHELWTWIPIPLRAALARRATRPVLAFDDSIATLWQPAAGRRLTMTETARVALDGDPIAVGANGRTALASLVRAGAARPRVVIALPARSALRKPLTLPEALEENLRQALAYDLDRHTPFRASDLYFDAVVTGRDPVRRTIHVELVAARRSIVDPLLERVEAFGADVASVTIDPPERAAWSKIDLLPDERRAARHLWSRWQVVLLSALLVLLLFAALILPLWQKRGEAIALIRMTDQARHRAEATDALRSDLERKVDAYNFPLLRKFRYPGTVQIVNDVTHILPDDTWLTQFEYRSGRGKDTTRTIALRGESANAGRLVALLQDSKLFTQAAPRSPTTKIQPGPGEIFDISAEVEPFATPKPASIDLSAPPPLPMRRAAPARPVGGAPPGAAATPEGAAEPPRAPAQPANSSAQPANAPAQAAHAPATEPAAASAGRPGTKPQSPAPSAPPSASTTAPSGSGPLPSTSAPDSRGSRVSP